MNSVTFSRAVHIITDRGFYQEAPVLFRKITPTNTPTTMQDKAPELTNILNIRERTRLVLELNDWGIPIPPQEDHEAVADYNARLREIKQDAINRGLIH